MSRASAVLKRVAPIMADADEAVRAVKKKRLRLRSCTSRLSSGKGGADKYDVTSMDIETDAHLWQESAANVFRETEAIRVSHERAECSFAANCALDEAFLASFGISLSGPRGEHKRIPPVAFDHTRVTSLPLGV